MSGLVSRRIEVAPRRWMFLPIGVKVRELDGSACLAFEAAARGWGVILGNKSLLKDRTDLPRGMQIEKKIANGTAAKIPEVWATGRKVSAWCEEGLVYPNAEEYGWRKVEHKAYDLLDLFFAWGRNQADDMTKLGCNSQKMVVTGNPRFDLHRADRRAVFAEKVARIRRQYAPFILVNTKFSLHNGLRASTDIVAKMRDQEKVRTPEQEAEMAGAVAFHAAGFKGFMALTDALSRRFPDHTIVVRPHPSELFDTWAKKAATLPNVRAIREGNVIEWILAAQISVHNNCTTGVESYLLGKPAISYRPVSDPRFNLFLPNALSVNAFDLDETLALVAKALAGQPISANDDAAEKARLAAHYIANANGQGSCERILDALGAADLPEERFSFSGGPFHEATVATQKSLRFLRLVQGNKKVPSRHTVHGQELRELLGATQRLTGRYGGVRINEIESNVFCIH